MLAIVAALLGANPLGDAVGLPDPRLVEHEWGNALFWRIVCGVVVGLLALAIIGFLAAQFAALARALARQRERPGMPISIALLACGTACVLATLWFEYRLATAGSVATMQAAASAGGAVMAVGVRTALAGQLAALGTFLLGCLLVGLGVWSSLRPQHPDLPQG
jgi:hypothetical protein